MNRSAVIFGISGLKLLKSEKLLFKKIKPWGIILFSRNVKDIEQLKNLVTDIKKMFKTHYYPILIDMEGGRVSRLNEIIEFTIFSQNYFGMLFEKNRNTSLNYYKIYVNTVSSILNYTGININTVPLLDVRRKSSHNIIGNRAFSDKVEKVSRLGNYCIKYYNLNKIATVSKHIPGHGLAKSDSHFNTPIIKSSKRELIQNDFKAFKNCNTFFAMTAHAIYSKYDPLNTATHSKIIINHVVRNHIKFKGILISDDISMKSLRYSLEINATRSLKAGCNLILHCNGNIKEMRRLAKVIPKIDKFTKKKTYLFFKFLR